MNKPKKVKTKRVTDKGISIRQQALADEIIKNQMRPLAERKNKGELVKDAGFSSTQSLHSEGVYRALQKYGLNEELVTSALVDDIKAKPEKRLGELTLAADILGMRLKSKDDGGGNKTLIVVVSGQSADRYGIQNQN